MSKIEQPHLWDEHIPELREKRKHSDFRISVLGGSAGEDVARNLGYALAKEFYPVQTGGYDQGVMKGALEGAQQAIQELQQDPEYSDIVNLIPPIPKGVVAGDIAPDMAVQGEFIDIEKAPGSHGLYVRLAKLMVDASAVLVLPGDGGTELEIVANLHFDKKLNPEYAGIPSKPLIFWQDFSDQFLSTSRYKDKVLNSPDVYKVNSEAELLNLLDLLQQLQGTENDDAAKSQIKQQIINQFSFKLYEQDKK